MTLGQLIEATKDHPRDAEVVIAGGLTMIRSIQSGELSPGDLFPHTAKVHSMADSPNAVILEL